MPLSFHTRRGKPRLESQHEHAMVSTRLNRNLPQHKRSQLGQIKPNFSSNSSNKNKQNPNKNKKRNEISEEELSKKMWKNVEVSTSKPLSAPIMSSSFATRYPEQREAYIRKLFPRMEKFLKKYGINIEAIYNQCSLVVSNTNRTWDPYAIIKSRDMIRLIARYVPFEHASKVMSDDVFSDIIEIGKTNVARNQVKFIRRRSRLIGPNGVTLRAIELLTKCYILVYGRTVCCVGDYKGMRLVRRIVMDCMNNIHPIYQLKRLMVQQELLANPQLAQVSWDRFLPSFKKKQRRKNTNRRSADGTFLSVNQIKRLATRKRRKQSNKYTPWPPAPTPSKIDIALENGAYWNKQWRMDNLRRMSAQEKYMKNKMKQQREILTKKETAKKKQKTLRRIRKEMKFIAPKERDSQKTTNKLRLGDNADKGDCIDALHFKENLNKFSNDKKRKQFHHNVDKFLIS